MKALRTVVVPCVMGWLALAVGTMIPQASAATVDLSILGDNSIYSGSGQINNNTGGWDHVSIGDYSDSASGNYTRGLFRFDIQDLQDVIDGLNPGESLAYTGITLTLYQSNESGGNNGNEIDTSVYQIKASNSAWVEGTAIGTAQNGSSSWSYLQYHSTPASRVAWDPGAGLGNVNQGYLGYDSSPTTALATGSFSGKVDGTPLVWNFGGSNADKTGLITDWLANTNGANLLVRSDSENDNGRIIPYSREYSNASYHPKLTITYSVVPEPSTFAMLLFGSVMLWVAGRKRR